MFRLSMSSRSPVRETANGETLNGHAILLSVDFIFCVCVCKRTCVCVSECVPVCFVWTNVDLQGSRLHLHLANQPWDIHVPASSLSIFLFLPFFLSLLFSSCVFVLFCVSIKEYPPISHHFHRGIYLQLIADQSTASYLFQNAFGSQLNFGFNPKLLGSEPHDRNGCFNQSGSLGGMCYEVIPIWWNREIQTFRLAS